MSDGETGLVSREKSSCWAMSITLATTRISAPHFRGIEAAHLHHRRFSRVAAADPDGFAEAQAAAAAGDLTLDGTLVTDGVGVVDDPKCVQINTNTATNNTQTLTVYGTDEYNVPMLERLAFNGTTAAYGTKAFKTVTRAEVSAALAGTVTVGTSDILGLPFALRDLEDVVSFNIDGLGAGDPVPLGSAFAATLVGATLFTDTSIVLPTGGWVKLVGSIGAKYFSLDIPISLFGGAYSGGRGPHYLGNELCRVSGRRWWQDYGGYECCSQPLD